MSRLRRIVMGASSSSDSLVTGTMSAEACPPLQHRGEAAQLPSARNRRFMRSARSGSRGEHPGGRTDVIQREDVTRAGHGDGDGVTGHESGRTSCRRRAAETSETAVRSMGYRLRVRRKPTRAPPSQRHLHIGENTLLDQPEMCRSSLAGLPLIESSASIGMRPRMMKFQQLKTFRAFSLQFRVTEAHRRRSPGNSTIRGSGPGTVPR
jgi:hypothetical protein